MREEIFKGCAPTKNPNENSPLGSPGAPPSLPVLCTILFGAFVKFRPCQKEKDGCITIVENIGYKVALMIRKRLGQKPLFSRLTSRFIHSHTGVNKENITGGGRGDTLKVFIRRQQ